MVVQYGDQGGSLAMVSEVNVGHCGGRKGRVGHYGDREVSVRKVKVGHEYNKDTGYSFLW